MSTHEEEVTSRLNLIALALETNGPARSYQSDEPYFVRPWSEEGMLVAEARELARDPLTIYLALQIWDVLGLEAILADRHATAGLRKCLINKHVAVRAALARYAAPPKPKGKPGPRAPEDGKHKMDIAAELRAQGLTYGKIAKEMYGDARKSNRVGALLAQRKKKDKTPLADQPASPTQ